MGLSPEDEVTGWALGHAVWIRSAEFSKVDRIHIAEELEGIHDSCRFELMDHCSVLLAWLARWNRKPGFRRELWCRLIGLQRSREGGMSSLRALSQDLEFMQDV